MMIGKTIGKTGMYKADTEIADTGKTETYKTKGKTEIY